MQILEIVLSFALLMIVFSSIASGITEIILRFIPARARNLQRSIDKFLSDIIWPNYIEATNGAEDHTNKERDKLLESTREELIRNAIKPAPEGTLLDMLFNWTAPYRLDALSTEAFVERLAKTQIGSALAKEEPEKRLTRLKDITLTYERYMASSSELFRKRANGIAFVISIALATAGNIHFGRIVEHLRQNPEIVAAIIEDQNTILAIIDKDGDGNVDRDEDGNLSIGTPEELAEELDAIRTELDDVRAKYDLPIGWGFFPYGDLAPEGTGAGMNPQQRGLLWFAHVVLAGLLIGLGAPFWYRVVKNIGQVRVIAGTVSRNSQESVGPPGSPTHGHGAVERAEEHARLFEASAQIKTAPQVDDTPAPVG